MAGRRPGSPRKLLDRYAGLLPLPQYLWLDTYRENLEGISLSKSGRVIYSVLSFPAYGDAIAAKTDIKPLGVYIYLIVGPTYDWMGKYWLRVPFYLK